MTAMVLHFLYLPSAVRVYVMIPHKHSNINSSVDFFAVRLVILAVLYFFFFSSLSSSASSKGHQSFLMIYKSHSSSLMSNQVFGHIGLEIILRNKNPRPLEGPYFVIGLPTHIT